MFFFQKRLYIIRLFQTLTKLMLVNIVIIAYSKTAMHWNCLPVHIRSLDKVPTFKHQQKSHLFQSAFVT